MFGFRNNGANVYAQLGLETGVVAATPNKLIIMLYEGAISACNQAIKCLHTDDVQRKGELITKACLIIESGLRQCLDKKSGGDIALSLDALYLYMTQRLMLANVRNDVGLLQEVIVLLTDLKSAWEAIDAEAAKSANGYTKSNAELIPNINTRHLALGT